MLDLDLYQTTNEPSVCDWAVDVWLAHLVWSLFFNIYLRAFVDRLVQPLSRIGLWISELQDLSSNCLTDCLNHCPIPFSNCLCSFPVGTMCI